VRCTYTPANKLWIFLSYHIKETKRNRVERYGKDSERSAPFLRCSKVTCVIEMYK
jgi:hypothetical protein